MRPNHVWRIIPARAGFTVRDRRESRRDARIIPARAGFTGPRAAPRRRGRDHPRSRGVYTGTAAPQASSTGSSPLARGLPPGVRGGDRSRRIIPARAGFTARPRAHVRTRRDHPRSRGVYPTIGPHGRNELGSSPLARGLLDGLHDAGAGLRIIPARAGFTCDRTWSRARTWDHPRSRGVYPPAWPR